MATTVNYRQDGPVVVLSLNRPDSLNGFTSELCTELLQAFERASSDESVRVVVLTGEGRAFSAGADLKAGFVGDRTISGKLQFEYRPVLSVIAEMPKPVIAGVNGFAAGIALSFAMHSDLLVMGQGAFLLSPFTTISLVPDGGANWLLVKQIGYHRAFQLSIESERVSADRCLDLGIANKVVPDDEVLTTCVEWGKTLSERAPLSIAATKKVMRFAIDGSWSDSYNLEAELQEKLKNTGDADEGVAAFLAKRAPVFKGQ